MRAKIATLLLIVLAFNAGIRSIQKNTFFHREKIPLDEATRQENRLQGLKRHLPQRGIVGFVQEASLPLIAKTKKYYLTQYTLVPLVVVESDQPDLIIANFSEDAVLKKWLQGKPFSVLENLNNGVALLKRGRK